MEIETELLHLMLVYYIPNYAVGDLFQQCYYNA